MVYKKYGITFQNMRKQNRFTLSEFAEVGIPTSTLSDFERGLTMISLEKIDLALQLMGYSLSDFDSHLNFYSPTDPIHLLKEVEHAVLLKDNKKLHNLHKTCKETKQKYICLMIKFLLKEGSLEEKDVLINYLYDTKAYGIKELSIFYTIMHQLTPQDILNIMKRLKKYGQGMSNSETYHRHLSFVMLEVILVLSNYGLKDEADYFIKRVEELKLAQTMLLRNLFEAAKGLWIYHFKSKEEGIKQIKKVLEILHLGADPIVAKFHQETFETFMGIELND